MMIENDAKKILFFILHKEKYKEVCFVTYVFKRKKMSICKGLPHPHSLAVDDLVITYMSKSRPRRNQTGRSTDRLINQPRIETNAT